MKLGVILGFSFTAFFLTSCITIVEGQSSTSAEQETQQTKQEFSDSQIRQMIIRDSIRSYSGNCPCPYNRASNGSRCGGRSAYSRPGGASPICYENQITDAMVEMYRKRLGGS